LQAHVVGRPPPERSSSVFFLSPFFEKEIGKIKFGRFWFFYC
jgi:hypothetical protein